MLTPPTCATCLSHISEFAIRLQRNAHNLIKMTFALIMLALAIMGLSMTSALLIPSPKITMKASSHLGYKPYSDMNCETEELSHESVEVGRRAHTLSTTL